MAKGTSRYWAMAAVAAVLAAAALSAWAAYDRNVRESSYRTVEVCLDYDDFSTLANQSAEGPLGYWKALREAGATSVAVSEASLGWLEDAGYIDIGQLAPDGPNLKYLVKPNDRISAVMLFERAGERFSGMARPLVGGYEVSGLSYEALRSVNIGPNDYAVALVKGAGFDVVLRLSAFAGFDEGWVKAISGSIGDMTPVIFAEKQVGGFPNRMDGVAEALKSAGAVLGQVEFAGQLGMDALSAGMSPRIIRVHSITPEELAKGMPEETAVERFVRAVRERSMRLLYIRPYRASGADSDPSQHNLGYVGKVAASVREAGFELGRMDAPPHDTGIDRETLLYAIALGSSAAAYLILLPLGARLAGALAALAALAQMAMMLISPGGLGASAIPFIAAVSMPCLGAAAWLSIMRKSGSGNMGKSVLGWAAASAASVAGGLMLAAPVADTAHMLGVGLFTGVKLAQALPLGFALVAFWALAPGRKGIPDAGSLVKEAAVLGMEPIRWWHAAVVGMAGLAGIYMLLRSGNSNPALVTGFEATARQLLEKLLVYRPRSKEVFIGHPALIAAGFMLGSWPVALSMAAFVLGMVGQVSMVNTFMHLHTPVAATMQRTLLGLALGLAFGLVASAVLKAVVKADSGRWRAR